VGKEKRQMTRDPWSWARAVFVWLLVIAAASVWHPWWWWVFDPNRWPSWGTLAPEVRGMTAICVLAVGATSAWCLASLRRR
jgi:hypothetical protein